MLEPEIIYSTPTLSELLAHFVGTYLVKLPVRLPTRWFFARCPRMFTLGALLKVREGGGVAEAIHSAQLARGIRYPGTTKYEHYDSAEAFADRWAGLMKSKRYQEAGIGSAKTEEDFANALKRGSYYDRTQPVRPTVDGPVRFTEVLSIIKPPPTYELTVTLAPAPPQVSGQLLLTPYLGQGEIRPLQAARVVLPMEPNYYTVAVVVDGWKIDPPEYQVSLYANTERTFDLLRVRRKRGH